MSPPDERPTLHQLMLDDLTKAVREAYEAAHGDDNDAEIEAWKGAAEQAMSLLDFDYQAISDEVDTAHEHDDEDDED